MPLYEYVCKKCGHEQEALHKVDEKPRLACDECGVKPLSRLVSAAGFRLSGGGWYETDFKSDNKKNLTGDKDKPDAPVKTEDSNPKTETAKAEPVKTEPAKKPKAAVKEKASKSAKK